MTVTIEAPDAVTEQEDERTDFADGVSPKEIRRATIVLALHIGMPGFRRKMNPADVVDEEDTVDRNMLHLSKDLLDPAALSEIVGERDKLKRWLGTRAIPCKMLRGGMMLFPLALVEEVDARVAEFVGRFQVLVDRVSVNYEYHKQEAEKRLGDHFDASEYPSLGRLQRAFEVEARWLTFNVPAALKGLKRSIYEREKTKASQQWAEAREEMNAALREGMAALVTDFADKLGVDDKGKKRTFRDEKLAKMQDFLAVFEARNLTNDAELAALAGQARDLLRGIEPEQLRKQDVARERVREGFEQIKASLDALLVPAARRKFADEDV